MEASLFWKLVRHEMNLTGDRSKEKKRQFKRGWKIGYALVMLLLFFIGTTLLIKTTDFRLSNTWYFTFGLPYMVFFIGFGHAKREWSNDTLGWWLSLPYSRLALIGAKYVANLIQCLMILAAILVVGFIYVVYIAAITSSFNWPMIGQFMILGCNWMLLIALACPILIGLGQFLAISQYTNLRVITPILWFCFMGLGSMVYWSGGFFESKGNNIYIQFSGDQSVTFFPFSTIFIGFIILGWVLIYFVIRLTAYLIDRKLSL
ncbi:hypothetical protein GCM10011391_39730 [Pullulanibacillus camelliae]|uniref:Uncharacterized protein n=1 Tax=Pullulanibacillus camelliae TaxID=1707096 RepID=A0A8J3E154_9BACL|nr:ABC transporter permease subunit [Pullulanibacillus camelliae]GGE56871.1 hypothetical protein GCM10011391_39730 [Pullulanibacillus camelliae]